MRLLPDWNANSHADRRGHRCPSVPAMQHSSADGPVISIVSQVPGKPQAEEQQPRRRRPDCRCWCKAVTTSPWLLKASTSQLSRRATRGRFHPDPATVPRPWRGAIAFALAPARPALLQSHEVVGKFPGSGHHYLKPVRFRLRIGTTPAVSTDSDTSSPTLGSGRAIFRQPPTNALVSPTGSDDRLRPKPERAATAVRTNAFILSARSQVGFRGVTA